MADLSHIKLEDLIGQTVSLKKQGRYLVGACPFCKQGKDRFYIVTGKQYYKCRQCQKTGDAITWTMETKGVSFADACRELGVALDERTPQPRQARISRQPTRSDVKSIAPESQKPATSDPAWQAGAQAFTDAAWRYLFHEAEDKLEYLLERGFSIRTLDSYAIGFNPESRREMWGDTEVWLPRGIVIPWYQNHWNGDIMRVNIRQDAKNASPKYIQAAGGANWLYLGARIKPGCTVVLVEGEFDALIIRQAYNHHRIVPVATGSTTGSRLYRWVSKLALAKRVLVAYDTDEAGTSAAAYWLNLLPNAARLAVPQGKDVNDFWEYHAYDFAHMGENGINPDWGDNVIRDWIGEVEA